MPHTNRTPADGGDRGSGDGSSKLNSPDTTSRQTKQDLLDRLDVIEVLSHWKLELQAKLARKDVVFLFADADTDFGPLAEEVRDFKRVSAMLRWMRRRP